MGIAIITKNNATVITLMIKVVPPGLNIGLKVRQATMAESKKTVASETQDRPAAPAETLSELDKLVVAFIDGALDVNEINKLDIFNRWLVLSMSAIYSCTKIGL